MAHVLPTAKQSILSHESYTKGVQEDVENLHCVRRDEGHSTEEMSKSVVQMHNNGFEYGQALGFCLLSI
jgi:hypothetical protein